MHLSDFLYFVLFAGLAAAVLYALKRLQSGRLPGMPQRRIRILEAAALGTRQRVVLLRVNEQEILVGVSPQQITTLATFPLNKEEHTPDAPAAGIPEADALRYSQKT